MNILLTNDDGYKSAGIRAIQVALNENNDITTVAPTHEQSATSKSVSARSKLKATSLTKDGSTTFHLEGTPADCVQIGMYHLMDKLPDLVVSGINIGTNVGYEQIFSSATVGAAFEAALQGVPAIAISLSVTQEQKRSIDFNADSSEHYFTSAALVCERLITKIRNSKYFDECKILCVNVPWGADVETQWVITKPHDSIHEPVFRETSNHFEYDNMERLISKPHEASDLAALRAGYVSIVPLNVQLTYAIQQRKLAEILNVSVFGQN